MRIKPCVKLPLSLQPYIQTDKRRKALSESVIKILKTMLIKYHERTWIFLRRGRSEQRNDIKWHVLNILGKNYQNVTHATTIIAKDVAQRAVEMDIPHYKTGIRPNMVYGKSCTAVRTNG
jgi:hypothetical protein